jgi:Tfp pilus assembly protein PilV
MAPSVKRSRSRRQAANSLLEVLIAIFVIATGASIFCTLIPTAKKSGKMVGNHQQAASLIQHKIDQLRAVGFGRLTYTELKAAGIIDTAPSTLPYRFEAADGLASIYRSPSATIQITDFSADIKQVTVTLTWSGTAYRQGNGTITATALIARG